MKATVSLVAVLMVASQVFAGMTITSVTKTEGAGKGGDDAGTMRMKVEDENAKIEWVEGRKAGAPGKGYMLTKDGGKTLYMVDTGEKTYMKWDPAAMVQMAAGMANMMSMKVKEYKVEKVAEEDGPAILGYPTRHYKFVTTFSMEMSVLGMKQTSSGKSEHEVWTTTKVKMPAMTAFEKMTSMSPSGFGDLQKVMDAEKAKVVKGFPLKTVTTTDSGTPQRPQVTKNIMEVTELKEGRIAASEFEIPKDYKETSMAGAAGEGDEDKAGAKGGGKSDAKAPAGLEGLLKQFGPRK